MLLYLTPIGLIIDVIGFILIVRFGHSLFIMVGKGPPTKGIPEDTLYLSSLESDPGKEDRSRRRRWLAIMGAVMVVVGFILQIIGAVAAIQLMN